MVIRPLRIWRASWGWRGGLIRPALWLALAGWGLASPAEAQPAPSHQGERAQDLDLPASPLPQMLAALARRYGAAIGSQGPLPVLATAPLHGRMTLAHALARLLAASGWQARRLGEGLWRIEPVAGPPHPRPMAPSRRPAAPAPPPPEIHVAATKQALALGNVPMGLQLGYADDLAGCAGGCNTARLAAGMTGVALGGQAPGVSRLFLQGIADSAFNGQAASTVAVLLDEARISYAGPEPALRLVDVERVEVLEGPQGALYGAGTLGGIYRIVTRRPALTEWSGEASMTAQAGDHTLKGPGAGFTAVLNAPLVSGVAGLRLVGYGEDEAGWITTIGRPSHQGTTNTSRTAGGRAALAVAPGGPWRLDLTGLHQTIATDDSDYVYTPGQYRRPAQAAEPSAHRIDMGSALVSGRLGTARVTLSSAISWLSGHQAYDASVGANDLAAANPGFGPAALYHDDSRTRLWDNEARLDGRRGHLGWLVGLSWLRVDLAEHQTLASTTGSTMTIGTYYRRADEAALFGKLAWDFAPRWQVEAGGRLYYAALRDSFTLADAASSADRHQPEVGFSPEASLAFHPRAGAIAYLRLASAFRQADVHSDEDTSPTAHLAPGDRLDTVELGWRARLGRGGEWAVSAHGSRWRHVQSDMLGEHNLIVTRDAGDARILGAQGHAAGGLGGGWSWRLAGEVENANLIRNALGAPLDDMRLPVVPAYQLSGSLGRQWTVGGGQMTARLSARQLGPGRLSFDPLLDRRIGPRLETDAALGLRWRHGWVALAADNLLGSRADVFAYGNPFRIASAPQYAPLRPRSLRLTVGLVP